MPLVLTFDLAVHLERIGPSRAGVKLSAIDEVDGPCQLHWGGDTGPAAVDLAGAW